MKITVIGSTGMIGSRIVAEAAQRGHEVTAVSRSGGMTKGASRAAAMELSDTSAVSAAIDASDATVIAVSPDRSGGSHEPTIRAHRNLIAAQPSGRFLVVGGAGSLEIDGVRLKDTAGFPSVYYNEATTVSTILDLYRASRGLAWSMLSPPPMIAPGQRTGVYRVGLDSPIGDVISAEDFAVAIVDELEKPAHTGTRFTVANQRT
jgi:putative NADH-flavin reductase